MTEETFPEGFRGGRMSDAEIDEFLRDQGTGVLSLADGNNAYAVPISFGYERGRAVFAYWQFGDESEKLAYSEATERACLAVYDIESQFEWRSVLAFGSLRELTQKEWSQLGELMDDNAWSPDLSMVGGRRLTVVGYEMDIEEATGLKRTAADDDP
ncbi:pyridoxamine 5'-phosphate oxidase family protein [Halobellus marinus]|uniref:pyridoxamine 5'-phosphate oxidase family protein n=1 Tax=Halobellus TaxID=1073986 RepID=UPI0028AAE914|nr:pyridoxamine 5'-phosphate oxidase family protein [Halobellus sp. DFY28]